MPKPYSLDLRERVVSFVQAGHSRRAAAGPFRVSPSFVINLMTAFRARGALAPKALGRLATQQARPAPGFHFAPRGGEGRHQHAGAGRRTKSRQRRESRSRLVVALADPQRPEL